MKTTCIRFASIGLILSLLASGVTRGEKPSAIPKALAASSTRTESRVLQGDDVKATTELLPLYTWNGQNPTILLPLKLESRPMMVKTETIRGFIPMDPRSKALPFRDAREDVSKFSIDASPLALQPAGGVVLPIESLIQHPEGELHITYTGTNRPLRGR